MGLYSVPVEQALFLIRGAGVARELVAHQHREFVKQRAEILRGAVLLAHQ